MKYRVLQIIIPVILAVNFDCNNSSQLIEDEAAYNPPCAITEFAACPVPPMENHLSI